MGENARSVSFESLEQTPLSPQQAAEFGARALHEVTIAVGRSTIAVRFSRASAAVTFAERFRDMLGTQLPDAVVYAVALDGEAYFWLAEDRARRWPENLSDELLVFFADNVALHEYLTASNDVGMHAAVIASGTRVVALVGLSTAGKTTTAIAAVRAGYRLYSDERCILQDGSVVSFLRAITVREGGRAALLASSEPGCGLDARLRELPARGDTVIRPRLLLGERAGGPPLPLGALFLIAGRAAAPVVGACSLYAALPALLRSMVSRDAGIGRAARLLAELQTIPLFTLWLGTPHATVRSIERTVDEAFSGADR